MVSASCLHVIFYVFLAEEKKAAEKFEKDMLSKRKSLTVELQSVKPMMEKVVKTWDDYGKLVTSLQKWLSEAEEMLKVGNAKEKVVSRKISFHFGKYFFFVLNVILFKARC